MRAVLVALPLQLEFGLRLIGRIRKLDNRMAYLHVQEDSPGRFVSRK
jgi:hypothetical protein